MNRKLFFPLMICALLLAGCYRQTTESFQQVDSGSAADIASPTAAQSVSAETTVPSDSSAIEAEPIQTATGAFLTPQPPPAQVEQPTIIIPTSIATATVIPTIPIALPTAAGLPDLSLSPIAAATLAEEGSDRCVYSVVAGDTLFRLSLVYDTTVEDLMDFNELESDALQIDQLLQIPDCVPGATEEDTEDTGGDDVGGGSVATIAPPATATPTLGSVVRHIVVAGDTLGSLALFYDVSVDDIVAFNQLINPDALAIGQELMIPVEN